MKTGKTLIELATEITRQAEAKRDLVADTGAIQMAVMEGTQPPTAASVALHIGNDDLFGINGHGHDQIGNYVGIPSKYYDRMLAEAPALLADNVNEWLVREKDKRLVRTLDGKVRAFLSDQYRPLENGDLAEAVLPILADLKLELMSAEITERRLYIKAVDETIKRDVPTGRKIGDGSHVFFDTCSPAIIISNSEVGSGALSVETGVFTKVCTNLATISENSMKRRHVGARHALTDGEAVRHLLTDETKRATDKAIWMQVQDIVRGAFEEARFEATCKKLGNAAEAKIEGDVPKVVELAAKSFLLNEGEKSSVLKHLIEGGSLTQYGLHAAITRTAEDSPDYDRASELERIGWNVIELPANDWRRIAVAA